MKFALLLSAVAAANALVLDRYGTGSGARCITNDGPAAGSACVFPFNYWGVSHFTCTTIDGDSPWCATQTDDNDDIAWWGDAPSWGYCDASCPIEDTTTTTTTTTTTCQCGLKGGSTNTIGNSRIVGGQDTELHEYPWQVGLVWRNGDGEWRRNPWCGGTLISSTHVLTAAHCTVGDTPSNIRVLLGEHNITDSDFNRVDVAEIIEHPNYDFPNNDYAILRLANPVTFTNKVSPACLPADLDVTYAGVLATATGWGDLSWGGRQPDVLQEVNVTVTTNTECNNAWKIVPNVDITANMICATDYGKSVCKGDSGGPLIVPENGRQTVIGISSFVYGKRGTNVGCAVEGFPAGFARVTEKMDWILAKTAGTFSSTCAPLN